MDIDKLMRIALESNLPPIMDRYYFIPLLDFINGVIHYYDRYIFANNFCQVLIQNNYHDPFKEIHREAKISIFVNGKPEFESGAIIKELLINVDYNKKRLELMNQNDLLFQFTFDNYMGFKDGALP
jgi:hypothetical protein